MSNDLQDSYEAFVEKTVKGLFGPYAVARSKELKSAITFSLDPPVWHEKKWPEAGDCVVLSEITKRRGGWRAKQGRFFKPSDEANQQRAKE